MIVSLALFVILSTRNSMMDGIPFIEDMKAASVTLVAAINRFMDVKRKSSRKSTIRSYNSYCEIFKEWLAHNRLHNQFCALVTKDFLDKFLDDLYRSRDFSNRTYNNYCSFLYTLFDWFCQKKFMSENPAVSLERKRTDRNIRTIIPPCDRKRIKDYFAQHLPIYYLSFASSDCYAENCGKAEKFGNFPHVSAFPHQFPK